MHSLEGIGERSTIMAEAVAILEGLHLAMDMGIQKVELEIDLLVLINYLSSLELPISHVGSSISGINLLASSFTSISF